MIRLTAALLCLPVGAAADITVVTDIPPIHSLTAQIMGDSGTPALLLPPGADAHDFAFRPSDATTLQSADLVIMVGSDLTPWLAEPVAALAGDAATLILMDTPDWPRLGMRSAHDHGHDDHNHADQEAKDPHGWMDPQIAAQWALSIADTLSAEDPDNETVYRANLESVVENLSEMDERYTRQLSDVGPLLWPHDGYQYLEVRYGLNAKGSIADVHAKTPGPGRIQALIDLVAAEDVACILTDVEINGDWATLVSDGSDAGTAFIDGIGGGLTPGPALYEEMMDRLVDAISGC